MPKTTFDVDVYEPKAGDTYLSISQDFYNDRRFAAALQAFNQSVPLQGGRYVSVPPIHILRRKFPSLVGAVVPVGSSGGTPTSGATGDRRAVLRFPLAQPAIVPARSSCRKGE